MDIVERLREFEATDCCSQRKEAADEIERLREELQAFREANMLLNSMIETEHKIIKTKGQ